MTLPEARPLISDRFPSSTSERQEPSISPLQNTIWKDGVRAADGIFEKNRMMLRELTSSSAETAKALEQATSTRCDLERQLQDWRRESDARKQKAGTGNPMATRRHNNQSSHKHEQVLRRSRASPLERRSDKQDELDSSHAKASSMDYFGYSSRLANSGGGGFGSNTPSPSLGQASLLPSPVTAASGGSAGSTQPAVTNAGAYSSGIGSAMPSEMEVAALRRYLATVKSAIADRDRELEELDSQEAASAFERWEVAWPDGVHVRRARDRLSYSLGVRARGDVVIGRQQDGWVALSDEPGFMLITDNDCLLLQKVPSSKDVAAEDVEEELRREESQVQQLEAALRDADLCIEESEAKLQLGVDDGMASGQPHGCSAAAAAARSGRPSLASTAPTLSYSAEQVWQDRARALEREIKSEAAQAMELQDRIHWLRAQLRKQPSAQDERVMSIQSLFEQIHDRLDFLTKQAPGHKNSSATGIPCYGP